MKAKDLKVGIPYQLTLTEKSYFILLSKKYHKLEGFTLKFLNSDATFSVIGPVQGDRVFSFQELLE